MEAGFLERFFRSIQQESLPGKASQWKMAPAGRGDFNSERRPELAAVMILLFPNENEEWSLLLQKRTNSQREHSGEVSFPGGKKEISDSDLKKTAIRELNEEMGIGILNEQILCELTPLYIPVSNFMVHVFLSILHERPILQINQTEVLNPILLPLSYIMNNKNIETALVAIQGNPQPVPCFRYDGNIIWGATAMILSELSDILRQLQS